MPICPQEDIETVLENGQRIDEALTQAARAALLRHKQAGLPVAIWRDGKVAWVRPEEVDPSLAEATFRQAATAMPAAE